MEKTLPSTPSTAHTAIEEEDERLDASIAHLELGGGMPVGSPIPGGTRLSTITELTEESRAWPSRQELIAANAPRPPPSTPTTTSTYGRLLGKASQSVINVVSSINLTVVVSQSHQRMICIPMPQPVVMGSS